MNGMKTAMLLAALTALFMALGYMFGGSGGAVIALLAGTTPARPQALPVRLGFPYRKKAGRREYVRVSLAPGADGIAVARKHPRDGAGILTSLTETDGLVELAEELTGVAEGTIAPFFAYDLLTG